MTLRIHRTWRWEQAPSITRVAPIGAQIPLQLVAHDELQYLNTTGQWAPVEIVEEPQPAYPYPPTCHVNAAELQAAIDRFVADKKLPPAPD